MPVVLAEKAKDRGTYPVTVAFFDSAGDGEPVTPSAATWTLLGRANQVINERDAVVIEPGDGLQARRLDALAVDDEGHESVAPVSRARFHSATASPTGEDSTPDAAAVAASSRSCCASVTSGASQA